MVIEEIIGGCPQGKRKQIRCALNAIYFFPQKDINGQSNFQKTCPVVRDAHLRGVGSIPLEIVNFT
jgi:hypothetical protein